MPSVSRYRAGAAGQKAQDWAVAVSRENLFQTGPIQQRVEKTTRWNCPRAKWPAKPARFKDKS
jgi:hypothetical protein